MAVAAMAVGALVAAATGAAVAGTVVAGAAAGAQAANSMVATRKTAKILDFFNLLNILYSFRKLYAGASAGYPGTRYMR
jgi:hypothetical protein